MRHFKIMGLCLVAVFALAAMTASGASATKVKEVLQFNEGEKAAAKEAPGSIAIQIGTCLIQSEGHLKGNDAKTVTLDATKEANLGCNEHYSASGMFTSAELSTKGQLKLKGTFHVTEPGPCTYEFKTWKGATVTIPGPVVFEFLNLTGKLNKKAEPKNNASCAKTRTEEFVLVGLTTYQAGSEEFEPFEAVLVPQP